MGYYPASILNLIKALSKLPGIGEKTAERLSMYILRTSSQEAEILARSIMELKARIKLCSQCFALSDTEVCSICQNPARDQGLLCVVEQPAEMVAVEKSGAFNGLYHILQGNLAPMEGIGPDDIRMQELMQRIKNAQIREIVLATATNVEGEATAAYISEQLQNSGVKVTRIAIGVPMGGDLKYVDQATLKCALKTRHVI